MNNNLENASEKAKSGFDSPGKLLKASSKVPLIGVIILIVVALYFLAGSVFTPVRNCIKSISGVPECSDCTNKLMKTTINGRSQGECTANPGTGKYDDQCTLNCSN